jgi:hypothetical protein
VRPEIRHYVPKDYQHALPNSCLFCGARTTDGGAGVLFPHHPALPRIALYRVCSVCAGSADSREELDAHIKKAILGEPM